MAYLAEDAPVSLADIVASTGLFYIGLLVAAIVVATFAGNSVGDAMPALDWTYASNFTA